ncbi:hypothetical protein SSX86_011827 [Deinandra increscens subsp. villosa]|uniref:Pectinesterase inhibitor domain-containing protein n=1 Tax=Deinandra increscens subsp. villosa TaxID=3103831 RepID=A0AAP0D4P5_9ASTR
MELRARILIIISISSLILYLSVEGFSILPSSVAQPNSKLDLGSPVIDKPKDASETPIGLAPDSTSTWGGINGVLEKAQNKITPVTSSIVNEAEAITSSIFGRHTKASSPAPAPAPASFSDSDSYSYFSPSLSPGHAPFSFLGPNLPYSPGLGPSSGPSPSPFSGLAPSPIHPGSGPGPSLGPSPFLGPTPYPAPSSLSPGPGPAPGPDPALGPGPGSSPSPSGFFDHDIALAIEARIKQSQTNAQLAMDEAKKLLKDPNIASSETGVCLSKCVDKYGASLTELNRAIADLGARDVTLLADDFGAVETDISTCQACFTENIGEDSPLKALEEATTKAARECLNVMDYAA